MPPKRLFFKRQQAYLPAIKEEGQNDSINNASITEESSIDKTKMNCSKKANEIIYQALVHGCKFLQKHDASHFQTYASLFKHWLNRDQNNINQIISCICSELGDYDEFDQQKSCCFFSKKKSAPTATSELIQALLKIELLNCNKTALAFHESVEEIIKKHTNKYVI